ncbi:hypothetical protein GF322_04415 [Candidatus Dependentiae bacterium]|nr:hypothetical protein [Candidatus Dependentiae bacterium]
MKNIKFLFILQFLIDLNVFAGKPVKTFKSIKSKSTTAARMNDESEMDSLTSELQSMNLYKIPLNRKSSKKTKNINFKPSLTPAQTPAQIWRIINSRFLQDKNQSNKKDLSRSKEFEEKFRNCIDTVGHLKLNEFIFKKDNNKIEKLLQLIKDLKLDDIINKVNSTGNTPLHMAVINKNDFALDKLLACPNINVHLKDEDQKTALNYALEYNYLHGIKNLINHS